MSRIILHDKRTNNPICIKVKAIDVVEIGYDFRAEAGETTDCSRIYVGKWQFLVKETFEIIMAKIEKLESEGKTC